MSLTNSVPPTASGDVNNSASSSSSYPEQHHAGAVGYGPNYRQGASLGDKLTGLKEELKGKVTKNPGLVEHGREMKSGELKKKEEEEDMSNLDPFGTADDDDQVDSSTKSPDSTNTSSAFGTAETQSTGSGHHLPSGTPGGEGVGVDISAPTIRNRHRTRKWASETPRC